MKQKHNGGFSLIETVVAIAILGLIVVPCCSGMLMAIRINEKSQQMMQAQLAVSSAVETLMAEGISDEHVNPSSGIYDMNEAVGINDTLLRVTAVKDSTNDYYEVVVRYYETPEDANAGSNPALDDPLIKVDTIIRKEGG